MEAEASLSPPDAMRCRNARRFVFLRLTRSLPSYASSLIDDSVSTLFSKDSTCELNAITNSTLLLTARLHVNTRSLAHKVFSGISMLVASSFTQKRIALNTPSTRTCTLFSFTPHATARWMGLQDAAPPSSCLKNAVTSNLELYSAHSSSHDLRLTPVAFTHIS